MDSGVDTTGLLRPVKSGVDSSSGVQPGSQPILQQDTPYDPQLRTGEHRALAD